MRFYLSFDTEIAFVNMCPLAKTVKILSQCDVVMDAILNYLN